MATQVKAPLRLGADGLRSLFVAAREAAAVNRQTWLKANPTYIECVVQGCTGVVGPAFIRTTPKHDRYGLCPRRQQHHRLFPGVFDAPSIPPRRRVNAA
jgi:hypothetical protein